MSQSLESSQHSNLASSLDPNQVSLSNSQLVVSSSTESNVTKSESTTATQEVQKSYGVTNPTMPTLERTVSEPVTREDLDKVTNALMNLSLAISEMSKTHLTTSDGLRMEAQQHRLEELVQEQLLEQLAQRKMLQLLDG